MKSPLSLGFSTRIGNASFFCILALAMFASTFIIAALSVLGPYFSVELNLNALQFGSLSSAVFLSAAAVSVVVGRFVDQKGQRQLLTALFGLSAIGAAVMAVVPNFFGLLFASIICGVPMAAGNPVTNALIARERPLGRQGWIMGIKQSGQPANMILAGFALPAIAFATSWRIAMILPIVISLAGIVWVHLAVQRAKVDRVVEHYQPTSALPRSIRFLGIYSLFMGLGMSGVVAYLPLYAYKELGAGVVLAGSLTGIIGVTGLFARIAWGPIAERSPNAATPLVILSFGALSGMMGIMLANAETAWPLWLSAAIFGVTVHSWMGAGMMFVLRVSPAELVGRASGAVQVMFFIGLTLSPLMIGAVRDYTGSFDAAWIIVASCYIIAGFLAVTRLNHYPA